MASLLEVVLNGFNLGGVRAQAYQLGDRKPLGILSGNYGEPVSENGGVDTAQNSEGRDARPISWLGTPVWADVKLYPPGRSEPLMLDTVLVTVGQRKNIITTTVQGRAGTIKEYISAGDYDIQVRGAIVTPQSNEYPEATMRDLLSVLKQDTSIKVVSDFLRLFDVYELVVTDFNFPAQEGYQNVQLFEFTALSDDPTELVLNQEADV